MRIAGDATRIVESEVANIFFLRHSITGLTRNLKRAWRIFRWNNGDVSFIILVVHSTFSVLENQMLDLEKREKKLTGMMWTNKPLKDDIFRVEEVRRRVPVLEKLE